MSSQSPPITREPNGRSNNNNNTNKRERKRQVKLKTCEVSITCMIGHILCFFFSSFFLFVFFSVFFIFLSLFFVCFFSHYFKNSTFALCLGWFSWTQSSCCMFWKGWSFPAAVPPCSWCDCPPMRARRGRRRSRRLPCWLRCWRSRWHWDWTRRARR